MSKELNRRGFLKVCALGGVGLFAPNKEGEGISPLDVLPERTVTYSVPPFGDNLESIIGDGVYPALGYRHLQETVNVDYTPDGGHHIGVDFNWGDFDDDLGTPLALIMNGVCVLTAETRYRDLGKIAIFCHRLPDESLVYSRYAHLNNLTAEPGRNYSVGEIIASMGKSGWENGFAHLHLDIANRRAFEIRYMEDPWWYPHRATINNIQRYFLDPVEIIDTYLRRQKNSHLLSE